MTLASRLFALFPALHLLVLSQALIFFARTPSYGGLLVLLMALYLFPLCCFRLLTLFFPIREGVSDIFNDRFSPWWAGHQIQLLFAAWSWPEGALRLIPGAYSLWLRCWGSKIGKNVYWTPGVCNYDRNLLDIGDNIIFGERATTVCHVITPKKGQGLLKISKVIVEDGAFIGAGSVLSPGVKVEKNVLVRAGTNLYPGQKATKEGIQ